MNTQQNKTANTPVEVIVHWSNSGEFPFENESYSFDDFEAKAAIAASLTTEFYDKTKITVKFLGGMKFTCQLDLASHGVKGFSDYCRKKISYSETPEGFELYTRTYQMGHLSFLKSITWPKK